MLKIINTSIPFNKIVLLINTTLFGEIFYVLKLNNKYSYYL